MCQRPQSRPALLKHNHAALQAVETFMAREVKNKLHLVAGVVYVIRSCSAGVQT